METVASYFNSSSATFHIPRKKFSIKGLWKIYPIYNEKGLTILSEVL